MASATACKKCGTTIVPGTRFCGQCGADISAEQGLVTTAHVPVERPSYIDEEFILALLHEATLGHYEIQGELGRGGMAIVYLAHDIRLDRKVAIKVMQPSAISGAGMIERFKREARTSAKLSHPHIIPIHAVNEYQSEDGAELLYFVMKFVSGRSLESILKDVGSMPIPIVQTVLDQAGSALGYAHRKGVVHRDIKPGNIMIDEEGYAVVADFGIAKELEAENLTQSGAAVGTPAYMSPEQCQGLDITGASDQYSLGIVGYEMITGERPFVGDKIMEIMKQHFFDDPPPITEKRPDCPASLRSVIEKMLAKEPTARYASLEDAVAAVGGVNLPVNDPARTQMIDWAKQGAELQQMARLSTPKSPAATLRSTRKTTEKVKAAKAGKRPWLLVLVTLIAVGLGGYIAADQFGLLDRAGSGDTAGAGGENPVALIGNPDTMPNPGTEQPPLPTTGHVQVASAPVNSRIEVDGQQRAPQFDIGPGSYQLVITHPDYQRFEQQITVAAGDTAVVRFDGLRSQRPVASPRPPDPEPEPQPPAMGTVRVTIQLRGRNTYANVSVNGVDLGRQTGSFERELAPGVTHSIRLERPGFVPIDTTVTVQPGQTTPMILQLVRP